MKWALAQLYRYGKAPFKFESVLDLGDRIKGTDILDISPVNISGSGVRLEDDHYEFNIHIECICVLEDSLTLEPIDYKVDLDVTEEFDKVDSENVNLIPAQTIELDDVVWQNIYLSIPMRIVKAEYLNQ